MKGFVRFLVSLSFILLQADLSAEAAFSPPEGPPPPSYQDLVTPSPSDPNAAGQKLFIPLVVSPIQFIPQINVPYFSSDVNLAQGAIAWFGRVTPIENFADIRLGYNPSELRIRLQIFDRLLWYDKTPDASDLTAWDSASLYLQLGNEDAMAQSPRSYRFDAQLNWWEERTGFQAAYQAGEAGWNPTSTEFLTLSEWRGNAPNDMVEDRGWKLTYNIPFQRLGISGTPQQGTIWRMALVLHDRDDSADSAGPDHSWPEEADPGNPGSWGRLSFGLPENQASMGTPAGEVTIRNNLNGAVVADGMVGGSSVCGQHLEFWSQWGNTNWDGAEQVNVQNEADVSDWPCFSKYYLTFPLDQIPANKVIQSATLTLFQSGNAGGGKWGPAIDSLIQILTVFESWDEKTLTWNTAPLAAENVTQAWVKPVTDWPGKPGVRWTWEVSRALNAAYQDGQPLRLVLYSADNGYNSGKYFYSSDVGDWNEAGRPTLTVKWTDP